MQQVYLLPPRYAPRLRALVKPLKFNSFNAISLVKTAEASSVKMANISNRVRELAIQVKNRTYPCADRARAQVEVEELRHELNKIAVHIRMVQKLQRYYGGLLRLS